MEPSSTLCQGCTSLLQIIAERDKEIEYLQARIEELVRYDPLTGVLNQRSLIEMLETELLRSRRTGHPFCFALVHLDDFVEIGQKHGVIVADAVLKNFSEVAMKLLRSLDRFGRIDGAEFGIVLPATWIDQGIIAMERLTKANNDSDWGKIILGMTPSFSAGLTSNAMGDSAEKILQRATQAINAAKAQGNGHTEYIEEELPSLPPDEL